MLKMFRKISGGIVNTYILNFLEQRGKIDISAILFFQIKESGGGKIEIGVGVGGWGGNGDGDGLNQIYFILYIFNFNSN